jgi:endonuclease YncB( thermonuclease family)
MKCRLYGINAPEIKLQNNILDQNIKEEEKQKGIAARDYLQKILKNDLIQVIFYDFDKYGRPLIIIFKSNININDLMITSGHAVKYMV